MTAPTVPEDFNIADYFLYDRLNERGYVIYPGKVTDADCFRIGNIGRLFEEDMGALIDALRETLEEMGVALSSGSASAQGA